MEQQCIKCGDVKDLNEFPFRKNRNKHDTRCNKCLALQAKLRSEKAAETVHLIKNKICTGCDKDKTIDNFQFRKDRNTYDAKCKECLAIKSKQNYQDNEKARRKKIREEKKANKPKKIIPESKECLGCGEIKKINDFQKITPPNGKFYYLGKCKICKNKDAADWRNKHKDEIREKNQIPSVKAKNKKSKDEYNANNKEKIKLSKKKSALKNKDKIKKRQNDPKVKAKAKISKRKWEAEKLKDPVYKLRKNVSASIRHFLKKNGSSKGGKSTLKYLPYTFNELKKHLESQFEPWMTWENHGSYELGGEKKWHIDHIIPQTVLIYDLMDHINLKRSWSFANLRPLEAIANISKGDKISDELKAEILAKIDAELEDLSNKDPKFKIILDKLKLEEFERNNKKIT